MNILSYFLPLEVGGFLGRFADFRARVVADDRDIILQILSGIIFTLLGYLLSVKLRKPQKGTDYTFCVVMAFCISGTVTFVRETSEFLSDFLFGTNFLECAHVGDDHWLIRLLGPMMSLYDQRPLFDTDEDMLLSIVSALITSLLIYSVVRFRRKALFKRERLSVKEFFTGFVFRLKKKCAAEVEKIRIQCSIFDILFWWCTRALMLYAAFNMVNMAEAILLSANLLGTFAISLLHLIMPENSFFAKINYRVQSVLVVIIFLGSYVGNYVFIYNIIGRYDLFLHFISGVLCVIAGYYVAVTLIDVKNKKDILLVTLMAFCFSCMIMPAWEVSEFIGDYIWGTTNQGFGWGPTDDSFFFKVFGKGVGNTKLYYLFDTFYDTLLAFVTTVPAALCVPLVYVFKNKADIKNSVEIKEKVFIS